MFLSAVVAVLFTQNLLSDSGTKIRGIVSAVTGTPATQITIVSEDSNPPVTVDVQITPNTQFVLELDVAVSIPIPVVFDAAHIAKGQRVEVVTSGTGSPMVADRVKLLEQSLIGTVSNANGNTFTLTVSPTSAFASISGVTKVSVIMVNGFVAPMNGSTVRMRGLVVVNGSTYTVLVFD
jgi:hypothetical protein